MTDEMSAHHRHILFITLIITMSLRLIHYVIQYSTHIPNTNISSGQKVLHST